MDPEMVLPQEEVYIKQEPHSDVKEEQCEDEIENMDYKYIPHIKQEQLECEIKHEDIVLDENIPLSEDDNPIPSENSTGDSSMISLVKISARCNLNHGHNDEHDVFQSAEEIGEHPVVKFGQYQCNTCNSVFSQLGQLKEHLLVHKDKKSNTRIKENKRGEERPHTCNLCNKSFTKRVYLKKHIQIHTGQEQECDICRKSFKYLKEHMRVHTGERPYKCDICNKSFQHSGYLKEHMNIHTGVRPYSCETCNKTFTQSKILKEHMVIHTGERPYKCDSCNKSFIQRGHLKDHMRIHTGEELVKCDICDKSFKNLEEHKRIHTGERPYKCDACDKSFTRSGHLNRHVLTHTGEQLFPM